MPDPARRTSPQPAQPSDQQKASDVARAFREHDLAELRRLPRSEVAEQRKIREDLYQYLRQMYENIRGFGLGSPASNPKYSAVAGMVDLAEALCENAELALRDTEGGLGS